MALRNFVPKINKENRTIGTSLKKWLKGFFYDLHIEHNLTDETNNVSVAELKTSVDNSHTHSNKALLDSYTQTNSDLQDAVSKKHEHNNKTLLDSYTQTESNLADAVNKKHSHNNQAILDATQESFTTALKSSYDTHVSNTNNPHNTTAAQVGLGNVTNDAQLKRAGGDYNTFAEKITPDDADKFLVEDSEDGYSKKGLSWSNIKVTLKTFFDTLYAKLAGLTAGFIPYKSASGELANSPIYTDGTNVDIGTVVNVGEQFGNNGRINIGAPNIGTGGLYIERAGDSNHITLGRNSASGAAGINFGSNVNSIDIISGATSCVSILSTGNVGFGTTNPQAKLDIEGSSGDVSVRVGRQGSSYAELYYDFANFYPHLRSSNGAWLGIEGYQLDLDTGGTMGSRTNRIKIDVNGNVAVNTNQLYVQQSNGNVGIGTTSPGDKLDVRGGRINLQGSGTYGDGDTGISFGASDAGSLFDIYYIGDTLKFRSDWAGKRDQFVLTRANGSLNAYFTGNVGIGTTSPTTGYKLDVIGDIRCQALTQYSDANKKENVNDLNLGLDFVTKLRPVSFKWKDTEEVKEYEEVEEDVYEEQEVTTTEKVIELVDGKYVQKEIEKVVKQKVQVFDEVDLYDEQGNVIGKHQVARKQKVMKEVVKKQAESHKRKHFGLLAQEVEQIAKDLGIDMKDFGMIKITNYNNPDAEHEYGLDYTQLIPVLIKAIQDLAQKVNA